jgi:hypothetical protein
MQISGSEVQPPAAAQVLIVAESEISPDARVRLPPALRSRVALRNGNYAPDAAEQLTLADAFLNLLPCNLACNTYYGYKISHSH